MGPATLFKKTPTQTLSCEIRNLKNIYECLLLNFILKRDSNIVIFLWILWIIQNTYFTDDLQTAGSETPVRGLTSIKLQMSLQQSCLKDFNSIRKRLLHKYSQVSVSFVKFLWKRFRRTPPGTTSHMMVFFSFLQISEVCSLKSIFLVEQR